MNTTSQSTNPAISVLMPVWNGEKYLREAVDAVLAQTFADFELVIVDDGSTDGTVDIVHSYSDPRIRLIQLSHQGIVNALNAGIAQTRAEWIARLDSDDIAAPERLSKQWAAVKNIPDAVLCYSDYNAIGDTKKNRHLPRTNPFLRLRFCQLNPFIHSCVLYRKSAVIKAECYLESQRHAEDYGLWSRLFEIGRFICIPEALVSFRIHPESISRKVFDVQRDRCDNIARTNCRTFLRLDAANAERAYVILTRPDGERTWGELATLFRFCWRAGNILNHETLLWFLNKARLARFR